LFNRHIVEIVENQVTKIKVAENKLFNKHIVEIVENQVTKIKVVEKTRCQTDKL
jgi:hypothetical protein